MLYVMANVLKHYMVTMNKVTVKKKSVSMFYLFINVES